MFIRFFKNYGIHTKPNISFKSGSEYENKIYRLLLNKRFDDVSVPAGASSRCDITVVYRGQTIHFEIKNKGAFEGGSVKLYPTSDRGMVIQKECIQKYILGDNVLYEGEVLPWSVGNRTKNAWNRVSHVFKRDVYVTAPDDAISRYYNQKGVHYIQIEGLGLYHTNEDILDLNVPKFTCKTVLRIRCTKHMKQGVSTDITAALQFDRKSIVKSPIDLEEEE